jgi:hypothetical protein
MDLQDFYSLSLQEQRRLKSAFRRDFAPEGNNFAAAERAWRGALARAAIDRYTGPSSWPSASTYVPDSIEAGEPEAFYRHLVACLSGPFLQKMVLEVTESEASFVFTQPDGPEAWSGPFELDSEPGIGVPCTIPLSEYELGAAWPFFREVDSRFWWRKPIRLERHGDMVLVRLYSIQPLGAQGSRSWVQIAFVSASKVESLETTSE